MGAKKQLKLGNHPGLIYVSPNNVVGKTADEVCESLKIDKPKLEALLESKGIQEIGWFKNRDFYRIKRELSALVATVFDEILCKSKKTTLSTEIIKEKQKPSFGKEGNYRKLIFTKPKS